MEIHEYGTGAADAPTPIYDSVVEMQVGGRSEVLTPEEQAKADVYETPESIESNDEPVSIWHRVLTFIGMRG